MVDAQHKSHAQEDNLNMKLLLHAGKKVLLKFKKQAK